MGYHVDTEDSVFTGWELLEEPWVEYIQPVKRPFEKCLPVVWSGSTDGEVTGKVASKVSYIPKTIKTFEFYKWKVFPVLDGRGVLKACLLSNDIVWPQPIDKNKNHTPYIMISPKDMRFIKKCIKRKNVVEVRLSIKSRYLENQKISNVIAQKSRDASIIIGAHYDSFFNTVGAHDNASGTTALLCAAHRLSTKLHHDIRFVLFDAEEWNKLGSYQYVEKLESIGQLSKIKAMINIDSVGYGESIYISVHPNHKKGIIRTLKTNPMYRQINSESFILLNSNRIHNNYRIIIIQSNQFLPQFDTWPFIKKKIPVVHIHTLGSKPYPYFHLPDDNLFQICDKGYTLISDVATLVESLVTY